MVVRIVVDAEVVQSPQHFIFAVRIDHITAVTVYVNDDEAICRSKYPRNPIGWTGLHVKLG